jgi:hypothetical protein
VNIPCTTSSSAASVRVHFRNRSAVAIETACAGALVRVADDEADALVAKGDQVARHVVGGIVVVDADRTQARRGRTTGDDNGGNAGAFHATQHGFAVAQRRWQDDAIEAIVDQALRVFGFVVARLALLDEELDIVQARLVQQADEKFAQVGGARVAVQETNADRLGTGQIARFLVRRIVQCSDRIGDLAPGALTHQGFPVHDARDRHGGHASQFGDVHHRWLTVFHCFTDAVERHFTHVRNVFKAREMGLMLAQQRLGLR